MGFQTPFYSILHPKAPAQWFASNDATKRKIFTGAKKLKEIKDILLKTYSEQSVFRMAWTGTLKQNPARGW